MRISRGDAPAREAAGPEVTTKFTPEQLRKAAERLMTLLDQDGTLTDGDRARRRGITICKPDFDGLTPISGQMDPELAPPWRRCWPNWPHGNVQSRHRITW
ncbi:MAG: DUF222 domain-containing protein [Mycobacterium sp.]